MADSGVFNEFFIAVIEQEAQIAFFGDAIGDPGYCGAVGHDSNDWVMVELIEGIPEGVEGGKFLFFEEGYCFFDMEEQVAKDISEWIVLLLFGWEVCFDIGYGVLGELVGGFLGDFLVEANA